MARSHLADARMSDHRIRTDNNRMLRRWLADPEFDPAFSDLAQSRCELELVVIGEFVLNLDFPMYLLRALHQVLPLLIQFCGNVH